MNNPVPDLEAYSHEELKQALARLIVDARVEVLSDPEVHRFWQLYHGRGSHRNRRIIQLRLRLRNRCRAEACQTLNRNKLGPRQL